MRAALNEGRKLGCRKAWVLTYRSNPAAMRLYAAAGGTLDEQVLFRFSLGDT
jgi:hypothetical protein